MYGIDNNLLCKFGKRITKYTNCMLLTYSSGRVQKIVGKVGNYFVIKKRDNINSLLNRDTVIPSYDEFCVQDIDLALKGIFIEKKCELVSDRKGRGYGIQLYIEYYTYFARLCINNDILYVDKNVEPSFESLLRNNTDYLLGLEFRVGRFTVKILRFHDEKITFCTRNVNFRLSLDELSAKLNEYYIERLDVRLYPKRKLKKRYNLYVTEFLECDRVRVLIERNKSDATPAVSWYEDMTYAEFKTLQKVNAPVIRKEDKRKKFVEKPEYSVVSKCKDIANTMKEAGISNEDISSVYSKLRGY